MGSSTSYRREDLGFAPHLTHPSNQPSPWGPGYSPHSPGHSPHSSGHSPHSTGYSPHSTGYSPHSSHGSWHHGYHDGFGWFSAGGKDSPWPKPGHQGGGGSGQGFYAGSDGSDTDSDSEETDQEGGVSSSDDEVKNPSNNQGPDANLQQGKDKKPDGSDRNNQDNVDPVKRPIDFNIPEPVNRQNDTLEPEIIRQTDITGHIAVANPKPFEFDIRRPDLNRGDIPEASINNNNRKSNFTKLTEKNNQTGYQAFKPFANRTNGINQKQSQSNRTASNETLTQAYITGPDNTLADSKANKTVTNDTRSQEDTINPSIVASVLNTSKTDEPVVMDYDYAWAEPDPSIGSKPVPVLGQVLAPVLQWNVGIYTKTETPYSQICGGSLVKTDVVLTAAHCFWGDGVALRPALFAAAAGKLQRSWDAASDAFAQQSDIREIHIPPRFQGVVTSFQDDIAVARLTTAFEYGPGVMPVCLDFDPGLEREQLKGGKGTIVGWGLTEANGGPSERVNFLELPYLEIEQCITKVQKSFLKYITSDKICAGDFISGSAACKGDSGSGLVYTTSGVPYLRGLVSTAPRDGNECNAFTPATFTHIAAHATFLADHIPNVDEDCRSLYDEVRKTNDEDQITTVGTGVNRNEENSRNSTVTTNSQIKLNVTVQSGDGELHGSMPSPFPLTSAGQAYQCNCVCNL